MRTECRTICVGAGQLPGRPMRDAGQALADIEQVAARASEAGCHLLVLPECCYPCYRLGSREEYLAGDILRGSAIEGFVAGLAARHGIHIVAGLVHERGGRLYDAAVLFDASGQVRGRHLKTFLWDREHEWFEPGEDVRPMDTDLGRVGMVVCAEGRSPEVFASHAAGGAGLVAMPTAWVNSASQQGQFYNPQPDFVIGARAVEFGLPIVCANKFGQEDGDTRFCGMSMIVGADGRIVAKAPADEAALLTARVEVGVRPYQLEEATVRRLMETAETPLPVEGRAVRVAVLSGRVARGYVEAQRVAEVLRDLAGQDVAAVIAPVWLDTTTDNNAMTISVGPALLTGRDMGRNIVVGGVTFGCISGEQAGCFAWCRLSALEGAQAVCVLGQEVGLGTLRVRAMENRVFVLGASETECVAIAPNGSVMAGPTGNEPMVVELNLAEAADKHVAPRTNVWQQRRVKAYHLRGENP